MTDLLFFSFATLVLRIFFESGGVLTHRRMGVGEGRAKGEARRVLVGGHCCHEVGIRGVWLGVGKREGGYKYGSAEAVGCEGRE